MAEAPKDHTVPPILAREFWGPLITLVVGPEKETFAVHKPILCASSLFFRKALKEEWARTRVDADKIEFPHIEPDTMKTYIHWLYDKTLPEPMNTWREKINGEYGVFRRIMLPYLAKAYVLGEELMDFKFKNIVLETQIDLARRKYYFEGVATKIIYNGTHPASPARRLIVDLCVFKSNGDEAWTNEFSECPEEFFVDCTAAFMRKNVEWKTGDPLPWTADPTRYYEKEEAQK